MNKKYEKIKPEYLCHLEKTLTGYPCISKQQAIKAARGLVDYPLALMKRLAKKPPPEKSHRLEIMRDYCVQHFDSEQKADAFLRDLARDPRLVGQSIYIPLARNLPKAASLIIGEKQ